MSNPAAILNGDQIYLDELIRENARLTIQHEADLQTLSAHKRDKARLTAEVAVLTEQLDDLRDDYERDLADAGAERVQSLNERLTNAIEDLHFVMGGGDPCKVCAVKCAFGEGNCKPVWRGEKMEEAADQ